MQRAAILFLAGVSLTAPALAEESRPAPYAGSSSCRECHERFYQLWSTSMHGLAMQPYTPEFAKARLLQAERQRRGLPADLLDCLQFSDKLQLAIQDREFVETLGFGSAGAAKKVVKDLESLRNNLAHGQDITSHDWPQIARLARRVQQLYTR
jgi:hypothetical protein